MRTTLGKHKWKTANAKLKLQAVTNSHWCSHHSRRPVILYGTTTLSRKPARNSRCKRTYWAQANFPESVVAWCGTPGNVRSFTPLCCSPLARRYCNFRARFFLGLFRNRNSWNDQNNSSFSDLSWLQTCQNQLTVSLWRFYSHSGIRVARERTIVWLISTISIPE